MCRNYSDININVVFDIRLFTLIKGQLEFY